MYLESQQRTWRVSSVLGESAVYLESQQCTWRVSSVLGGSAVYLEARMDSVGGCFKCCRYLIESKFW